MIMAEYLSQKELVKAIEVNLNNLESGALNLSDIEKHVDLVRELYERTIVLRYKAFEHHSSVELITPKTEEIVPVIEAQETHKEDVASDLEIIEEIAEEQTYIDEVQEIEFDFFNAPETIAEDENPMEENSFESTVSQEEVIIEQIQQDEEQIADTTDNLIEEEQFFTESHVEMPESAKEITSSSNEFTQRVFEIEQEIKNQFGFYSLQTLIGSFGLNERLLYINELFDGSSESFSDAIKHLDSRSNLSEAATYIEEIGSKFNWNIESETVEEFIQKLCRRYA
jgi:hypothetical protein